MHIYIAGKGKMASALANECEKRETAYVAWRCVEGLRKSKPNSVLIHVGSRERLEQVLPWCDFTGTPLIHASSGQDDLLPEKPTFPIVLAPNLALPVVAFLEALPGFVAAFKGLGMKPELVESHQASKTSVAGTARVMAKTLDIPERFIRSVRNPVTQLEFGIPESNLEAHAYHWITLWNQGVKIELSTQVNGLGAYVEGALTVARKVVEKRTILENRIYSVPEILRL